MSRTPLTTSDATKAILNGESVIVRVERTLVETFELHVDDYVDVRTDLEDGLTLSEIASEIAEGVPYRDWDVEGEDVSFFA